ncbi:MAG: hypothetical protein ACETVZ_06105, partial [Phycisphaerae bacterium]
MRREKSPTIQKTSFSPQVYLGVATKMLMICALLCLAPKLAWGAVQESQKDSDLQIYLPREVTIEEDYLKLGQVSIIRGEES